MPTGAYGRLHRLFLRVSRVQRSIAPRLAFGTSVHVIEIYWSQVSALWMSERPRYASHAWTNDRCDYWGNGQPNLVKRLVGVQQLAVIDFRLDEQDQNLRMT